jgi:hypothetical protein
MRPAAFALVMFGVLSACSNEPDTKAMSVTVLWMDWPAEVNSGEPFRTRLIVWGVCAMNPRFQAGARSDNSAVTFEPYFLVDPDPVFCAGATEQSFVVYAVDTAAMVPGLIALNSRTIDMRGAAPGDPAANSAPGFPVRTFGSIVVRPSGAQQSRRNAAGSVSKVTDTSGCTGIRPIGINETLILEDQADTAGLAFAFVRGYIHDAPAPVCGATRVFHLVSKN